VNSLSDLGALSLDVDEDGHGLVVETLVLIIVANLSGDVSSDLLVVDGGAIDKSLTEEANLY
jgi:hypothetical protein